MRGDTGIGRGFDIVSPIYDLCVYLAFGNTLNNLQLEALSKIPACESCLIIGGGSGKILKQCIGLELANQYYYCELSNRMIQKSMRRLNKAVATKVKFANDVDSWTTKFDLIILPFVLDCYAETEVNQMINSLTKRLSTNGHILIVDFNEENIAGFQPQGWQRSFIRLLFAFFNLIAGIKTKRLPPIFKIAQQLELSLVNRWDRKSGWLQASLWKH